MNFEATQHGEPPNALQNVEALVLASQNLKLKNAIAATQKVGEDMTALSPRFYSRLWDIGIVSAGLALAIVVPEAHKGLVTGSLCLYDLGLGLENVIATRGIRKISISSLETPFRSRVKVLKARAPYAQIKSGDIVLEVSRGLPNDVETEADVQFAKKCQLLELRQLLDGAEYDHLILPSTLLRPAGTTPGPMEHQRGAVQEAITGREPIIPDRTNVRILSKPVFERLTKDIEIISDQTILPLILARLATSHQDPYIKLYIDDPTILEAARPELNRYLKQVLLHNLEGQSDQAYTTPLEAGPLIVPTKQSLAYTLEYVKNELRLNQYDHQRRLIRSQPAAALVPIHESIQDDSFWRKFQDCQYTDGQLAYLAISILQSNDINIATQITPNQPIKVPKFRPRYSVPLAILTNPELRRQERRRHWQSRLGAGLLAVALGNGVAWGVGLLPVPPQPTPATAAPSFASRSSLGGIGEGDNTTVGVVDWSLEDHGVSPVGYYQERLFNKFVGQTGWQSTRDVVYEGQIPYSEDSYSMPQLTLKGTISSAKLSEGIWLPIREGTLLGGVRLKSEEGTPLPAVALFGDGTGFMIKPVGNPGDGNLTLEFDLLDLSQIIPDSNTNSNPNSPQTQAVEMLAAQTRNSFLYDNTPALNTIVKKATDADQLLKALDHAGICNCNLCASRVTLLAQQRSLPVEYASGYINTGQPPVSAGSKYELRSTEQHAWVQSEGEIIDPTPSNLSKAQRASLKVTKKATRKTNENNKNLAETLLPLFGFVGLGLGSPALEQAKKAHQKKWLTRAGTQHAYDFLNWMLFGQPSSFRPERDLSLRSSEQLRAAIKTNLPLSDLRHYLNNQPLIAEKAAGLNYLQRTRARRLARKSLKGKV